MTYACTVLDKKYSKHIQRRNADLDIILENPVDQPKDKLPLFNFCVLKDKESERANAEYVSINALMLDYDSGLSIEAFKSRYSRFKWWLYTTSSHKPETPKFRVIMPLNTPIDFDMYTSSKRALLQYFPKVDPTTFDRNRFFYLPAKSDVYTYFSNDGELFDFDEELKDLINADKEYQKLKQAFNDILYTSNNYSYETNWDKCVEELEQIIYQPDGSGRYSKVITWIGRWKTISKDSQKVKQILENSGYHNTKALRSFFK